MKNNPTRISWAQALQFWFKLGFISFGGPAGQIATVHQELVEKKHWISEKRFLHALNYCMVLPGPEALQLVIYMGWLLHRTVGGIVAGVLFILPALILLILLSSLYVLFGNTPLVTGIFLGIKPAVTALIIHAGYKIGTRILKKPLHIAIACLSFLGILIHIPYPVIILSAGLIGFASFRYRPEWVSSNPQQHTSTPEIGVQQAVIGDTDQVLDHTIFNTKKFLITALICLLAWAIPFLLCVIIWGIDSTYSQLAVFFSKAALLTFGGAYAVLPYVFQAAVVDFSWLSAAQMMDGLALGETTPGPLIIVVAFVGYIAGHTSQLFESSILSGIVGAMIVSWFIFLPSFCFILLGGPFIESTRQEFRLTPILNGITCAVVGVIASLSVFFAYHTLWPKGWDGPLFGHETLFALAILSAACIALIRFQQDILRVLLASAILGIIWQWLMANKILLLQ